MMQLEEGAIEAGISLATSYPGTPATEILTYIARNFSGDAEWSVNEKVALETAIGASYAGKRAICSMKHVGLNVASDPLMTIAYLGIKGGLVLAVADDPGAYSSQNEQDSRFYSRFAKIPCLEPSDSQEARDMTIMAFDLSEKVGTPGNAEDCDQDFPCRFTGSVGRDTGRKCSLAAERSCEHDCGAEQCSEVS